MRIFSNKLFFLFILAIVLAGAVYWYEWRPHNIKIHCTYAAIERSGEKAQGKNFETGVEVYDFYYKKCLREKGL